MFKSKLLNNPIFDWQKMLRLFERFEKISPNLEDFKKIGKVALVKQYVYADLYSRTFINHDNIEDIIYSSNHRSGPMGLFKYFKTDFYIVNVEQNDIECSVYKEKGINERWNEISKEQKKYALHANEVNWSMYDLVICIENAIPYKVIKKHNKNTLWATMLETHTMPSYKKYLKKPPKGYDVFLNQLFGPSPFNFFKKSHVLDWSYSFNYADHLMFAKTKSIIIETHTIESDKESVELLNEFQFYHSNHNRTIKEYLLILKKTKYLILPTSNSQKILTGNITIEAAANKVLILGNKNFLWNPFVINDSCHFKSISQLKNFILNLEENPALYKKLLDEQSRRLNYFVFTRPLLQLKKK